MKNEVIVGEKYIKFFEYKMAYAARELSLIEYQHALRKLNLSESERYKFTVRYQKDTANPPQYTMTRREWKCDFPGSA